MSLSLTNNDYSGTFQGDLLLSKKLYETKTLEGNYVTVLSNVKTETNLPIISSTISLQADGCVVSPSGTINLTNKKGYVKTYQLKETICKNDIEPYYYAALLKAGASNTELPFEKWLVDYKTGQVSVEMERRMWAGNSSSSALEFDGFYVLAKADSTTVKVTGTTLTKSNIIGEVEKIFLAIPETLRSDVKNTKFFMSPSAISLYRLAVNSSNGDANFKVSGVGSQPLDYLGYEIVMSPLATNAIMVGQSTNLFFLTDLASDFTDVILFDKSKQGDFVIDYTQRLRGGAQIGIGAEVVVYN